MSNILQFSHFNNYLHFSHSSNFQHFHSSISTAITHSPFFIFLTFTNIQHIPHLLYYNFQIYKILYINFPIFFTLFSTFYIIFHNCHISAFFTLSPYPTATAGMYASHNKCEQVLLSSSSMSKIEKTLRGFAIF